MLSPFWGIKEYPVSKVLADYALTDISLSGWQRGPDMIEALL